MVRHGDVSLVRGIGEVSDRGTIGSFSVGSEPPGRLCRASATFPYHNPFSSPIGRCQFIS